MAKCITLQSSSKRFSTGVPLSARRNFPRKAKAARAVWLDAFLMVVGAQPVRVEHAAFGRGIHGVGVDDFSLVVLRAEDGTIGVVEAGYTHADPKAGHFEWRVDAAQASLADWAVYLFDYGAFMPPAAHAGKRDHAAQRT